jgi:tyrosine-protein phosphatase SIW14
MRCRDETYCLVRTLRSEELRKLRFWRQHYLRISALLVAGLCAAMNVPQTASPPVSTPTKEHSFGRRLTIEGVPNAGQVTANLYRGGQPTTTGFEALANMGINIVVDQRGSREGESERVAKLGMRYISIPWHCPFPRDETFARFLLLLRQNPGKKVFVHCRLGDDRTGMMVAAYRMAEQNWTAAEAKKEMEAFGFSMPHHLICPSLSSYEESFPQRFNSDPGFDGLRAPAQ